MLTAFCFLKDRGHRYRRVTTLDAGSRQAARKHIREKDSIISLCTPSILRTGYGPAGGRSSSGSPQVLRDFAVRTGGAQVFHAGIFTRLRASVSTHVSLQNTNASRTAVHHQSTYALHTLSSFNTMPTAASNKVVVVVRGGDATRSNASSTASPSRRHRTLGC